MAQELQSPARSSFPFRPSRRDIFRIGSATAIGAGTIAASSVTPAAAAGGAMSPAAVLPMNAGSVSGSSTTSYPVLNFGSGAGHVLTDASLAYATRAVSISIPTYEGSGVAVHPSVYFNPDGWNGFEYWMAYTPYPSANSQLENPSIAVSHDGNVWVVPDGLSDPIEPVPPGGVNYNSDPNITVGNDGLMYLFWRTVGVPTAGESWYFRTSTNGVNWSDRVTVRQDLQSVRRMVSPSFSQLADGSWVVYAVDIVPRPYVLVRLKAESLSGMADAVPQQVSITGNPTQPWHVDVHRVAGEWQMLVQDGGAGGGDIWAAVSTDGLTFAAGGPCIAREAGQWDSIYYKSCFVPATKNGVQGWDTWVTGASFAASGSIMGRTFVGFGPRPTISAQSSPAAAPDPSVQSAALTTQLLSARLGIYPWIIGDSFARADSSALGTADSGQGWTANAGVMKLANRGASPAGTANTRCVIESSTADHWPSVRIDSAGTATAQHWLLARFQDSNNFYRLGFGPGGSLCLQKLVAGVLSTVGSFPGAVLKLPGVTIGLRCAGNSLEIFVNGALVTSVSDNSLTAGTKVGMQANDGTAIFRSFMARIS